MGRERIMIVGVYIPPSETSSTTIHHLEGALKNSSYDKTIILGNLNVDLDHPQDLRGMKIVELIKVLI